MINRICIFAALLCSSMLASAQTIDIEYAGSTASVEIPDIVTDVTYTIDGAHVNIISTTTSSEYTYHVTGNAPNGSLTITGAYKLTLLLDGVKLTSQRGAAIDVECGKRIAVVLSTNKVNILEDCAGGVQKAAMYFTGHPEFEGNGILNVKGNTGHAISAKEYLQFKKTLGMVNILGAVNDGIHCGKGKTAVWTGVPTDVFEPSNMNEFFFCNGGTININNVGGDCIDTDDYGCAYIKGGVLNMDVASYDTQGIKAPNTIVMEGGKINMQVSGDDCDGLYACNNMQLLGGDIDITVTGNGSKAIKGKNSAKYALYYPTGGNVLIGDAEISVLAVGGEFVDEIDPAHCVGISIDGNLTNEGADNVYVTAAGGESRTITCDGVRQGSFEETNRLWYVLPQDYEYRHTAYVVLTGATSADYNNLEIGAFVGEECRGTLTYDSRAGVGHLNIFANVASGEKVTFRLYNSQAQQIVPLIGSFNFVSDGMQGNIRTPMQLRIRGNVDDSNIVLNAADVDGLANVLLSKRTSEAADFNADDRISIKDIAELIATCLK